MTKLITLQHKKNDTCISFFLFLTIIRLHIKIVIREITIQQKNRIVVLLWITTQEKGIFNEHYIERLR